MSVGVLLLAAGRAARFGADKRLARLPDGRQVLDATLEQIRAAGLPVLVCVARGDHALAQALRARGIDSLPCSRAGEGMGGTLAEAVGAIGHWRGALVALADMPWIAAATYRQVAQQVSEQGIVQPAFDGQRGHPVGFGRAFYPELMALAGDHGARRLLAAHAQNVTEVAVADRAILWDIDVPGDMSPRTW